jgi:propionyl-CoA carboxylase alpha chain
MAIPIYYDPMIAKLTVTAANRAEAIARMIRAIDEYQITGLQTTLGFCRFVMGHPSFVDGSFTTAFVAKYFTPSVLQAELDEDEAAVIALMAGMDLQKPVALGATVGAAKVQSVWHKRRTVLR